MSVASPSPGATIGEVLKAQALRQPHAPVIVAPEAQHTRTYGDLARFAARLSRLLDSKGVAPGETVAFYLHNGLNTTTLFLGIMAAGRIVAPMNLVSQRSQLAWTLAHCRPRLVFTCAAHAAQLEEALATIEAPPEVVLIDVDDPAMFSNMEDATAFEPPPREPGEVAMLMYTSGTTGTPKGVLSSHAGLLAGARAVAGWHGLTPDDRVLNPLPIYHINSQVIGTLAPFVSGGSMVVPRRFSTSSWWQLAETHRCTWVNMVPTIVAYLLNASDEAPRDLSRVRFGRSASAPLPVAHCKAFEERFGFPLIEAMGMTECASTVFCNPHDSRRRYGSPGLPCGVEAGVIDTEGRWLDSGEPGEIVLRGPNVMLGYLGDPAKTAEAIDKDGWLRTGDLGYRDADGFYFVTGRRKELIIKGGENIAPREIDEALLRHPAILEAAAFAVPDTYYGQEIDAALVLKPDTRADEAELREWCLRDLGKLKTPRRFHFVESLPKGPSGKIQRLKLVELLDKA